jgi:glycine oxidase
MVETVDVAVVGGGVIGSAVAWRAAATGRRVALVDPDLTLSASWVAGGMLAPLAEAWPGEEYLLELGTESLARWPDFARDLAAVGEDPGLRTHGTLVLAADTADREVLGTLAGHLAERGREVECLTGRQLRKLEPAIGPAVHGGLSVPGDLAVDNRRLLHALRKAAATAGARHVADRARSLEPLLTVGGVELRAETVVLAAGAWSGRLHPVLEHTIRPVKGEVLRLRARAGSLPPPQRTVRGMVEGRAVYLVPRDGPELVLGATQYEAGFDTDPLARGVLDLLSDAERLMPAVADYALVEVAAGLRAGSTHNLPVVDRIAPGVIAATGHHRNGLLLATVTADEVVRLLDGGQPRLRAPHEEETT